MTTELELSLAGVPLDLSFEELLDLAVPGVPAEDDFAFTLFHESDGEDSPRSVECDMDTTKLLLAIDEAVVERGEEMATPNESSGETVTFVEKTYYMVNTCASRLVCWNATGSGFFILDTQAFAREVLPDYFKHRNMNAFVSELTLHGFHKTLRRHKTSAIECLEFRHPHFVRGDVAQLTKINRRVSAPRVSSSTSVLDEAMASDDEDDDDDDDEFEDDDVDEHMGDLKCELSKLKGEVQQTQNLFDKLIVTLMQQNAAESSPVVPMHHPFLASFHHPAFAMFGIPPVPHGMHPAYAAHMAFSMGAAQDPSDPVVLGEAEGDDFLADLFPSFE